MSRLEGRLSSYFTDFDGGFNGRLAWLRPTGVGAQETLTTGTSARYECRVKVEYDKELMRLVEEGMILAVRNFNSQTDQPDRFTLLEISRVFPEHFGLKGLSEHSYYPVQFEIIEQAVGDWESNDKSTMMIQINAIPINYDLVIGKSGGPEYVKGFSYPITGEHAYVLNRDMIHGMYNGSILERMGRDSRTIMTSPEARQDPRLGTIKMFETEGERIPIYVDFERLVRYHFGIFGFTGGGKSNLLSNLLRRLVYHTSKTKIVIFDISMEYVLLLADLLADEKVPSRIVFETPTETPEQMFESVVKPRGFEDDKRILEGFSRILDQKKVDYYIRPRYQIPTYGEIVAEINDHLKESGKKIYEEPLQAIKEFVLDYELEHGLNDESPIDEKFVAALSEAAKDAVEKFKVSEKSNVYAWANSREYLAERVRRARQESRSRGLTTEKLLELIEGPVRVLCLPIADPVMVKDLAINFAEKLLRRRKRQFRVEPFILSVFDEAQEFIPALSEARGIDRQCSEAVETLLRQGRKYGLGCCVATQRIAYLNTNALQQLHTYFVGTLPRPYDRSIVSDTFMIDKTILEKTLEFAPGEWLLSSYIATGMENVPIFVQADNSESEIESFLSSKRRD